jgi:hypothetical protein
MKDKLEKFISENRQKFDDEIPGDEIWNKINAGLDKPKAKTINWKAFAWRAAAVIVIFMISYFFQDLMQQNKKKNGNMASGETIKLNRKLIIIREKQDDPTIVKLQSIAAYIPIHTDSSKTALTDLINDLPEVKAYYTTQIAEKEREINKYSASDPKIKVQIKTEFNQLDSIYNSLRVDSRDNINNREIVEAMIQNYRMRLELLENILQQLKEKDSQALNRTNHD